MTEQRLGDAPIEEEHEEVMRDVGRLVEAALNQDGERRNGFILMLFPFDSDEGRCNYISNAAREDVVKMLREQLAHFERTLENAPPEEGQ